MKIIKDVIESTRFKIKPPDLTIDYLQEAMSVVKQGACHTECLKG